MLKKYCDIIRNQAERFIELWLPTAVMLILFRFQFLGGEPGLKGTLLSGFADAAMILLPYWFLPRKLQKWSVALVWVTGLYLLANALYCRHFADMIPYSSWRLHANLTTLTLSSTATLFCATDIMYLLMPTLAMAGCFSHKGDHTKFSIKSTIIVRTCALACTLAIFAMSQWHYNNLMGYFWARHMAPRSNRSLIEIRYFEYTTPLEEMRYGGIPMMVGKSIWHELATSRRTHTLKEADKKEVDSFLKNRNEAIFSDSYDSATARRWRAQNKGKNLILIIVESLNPDVVGRVIGCDTITPTLNRLIASNGSMYSLQVRSQVESGGSSDGQMLYNTGIVPLRGEAAVMSYSNNTWHSLAKALGKDYFCAEVICEDPKFWNHDRTTKWWGYDKLVSRPATDDDRRHGIASDGKMFGTALALIDSLSNDAKQKSNPFFLQLTTLSMHMPFYDYVNPRMKCLDDDEKLGNTEKRYLRATRYFDNQLGDFLRKLKQSGILDNTIVAIASDHNVGIHESDFASGVMEKQGRLVFIVLNTGEDSAVSKDETCANSKGWDLGSMAQMDVYPTLLDVMGVGNYGWRGLGTSVLEKGYSERVEKRVADASRISDLIIRSGGR